MPSLLETGDGAPPKYPWFLALAGGEHRLEGFEKSGLIESA